MQEVQDSGMFSRSICCFASIKLVKDVLETRYICRLFAYLADNLAELFAETNSVALREEHNAVEGVAHEHHGALVGLCQTAAEDVGGNLSLFIDAKAEVAGEVYKFVAATHEGFEFLLRWE